MADQNSFNPGAYQFVPGQNFVPRQDSNAPPQQGQPGFNPYNPYGQPQQPQGYEAYQQQGYGGGYPQYGAAGGYGQQQGGYAGYQQPQQQQQQQYGGYQPPQLRQPQSSGLPSLPPPRKVEPFQPSGSGLPSLPAPRKVEAFPPPSSSGGLPSLPPARKVEPYTPPAASAPAKAVSLSIGGSTPAAPAKAVSISIGGAKKPTPTPTPAAPVAKIASLSTAESTTAPSSTSTSRAPTPAPAPKAEANDDSADWDAPEPESAPVAKEDAESKPAAAAEAKKETVVVKQEKTNFSRAVAKSDADAIAKEAARVADAETLQELYGGEEVLENVKHHLNLVFIGHVDAGKSTMGGQLLVLCGMVDQRTLDKLQKEAKEAGRESWYLSWALDSTPQERAKGKTVEVGRAYFETDLRRYTILDAPGHKTYVPSMISGAAQADIAILVISARKGEFETGFERGGQTREHAMLVKNNGVSKLIVVVNKMDDPTVAWAKERFDEVISKITPYLKSVGFNPKTDITFIPVSAYTGQNMKERVDKKIAPWHDGPALLEFLDHMPVTDRKINAPFMLPVSEKYNEMGAMVVGKIESGRVKKGDQLILMPNKVTVDVAGIFDEQAEELPNALCGDNVRIRLRGISDEDISPGFVLSSPIKPIKVVTQFRADLAILESKNIICAGYSCVLHLHTLAEEVTLNALLHYYDKKTGRKSKKAPQFAKKGMRVVALIETAEPICIEKYADYPMLGRFTLRDEGKTVAIGKVTKLIESSEDLPDIAQIALTGETPAAASTTAA